MTRALAAFVVAVILGSPALACAAMLVRQGAAYAHKSCHKKPQPEAKCCLLNPAVTSEPASKESAAKWIAATFAELRITHLIPTAIRPVLQTQPTGPTRLYILTRSLRL